MVEADRSSARPKGNNATAHRQIRAGGEEARTMTKAPTGLEFADLAAIAAAIERSQIVVPRMTGYLAHVPARCLPAGFDDVDVAVLEWIAAEARRFRRPAFAV
jgi:hypothetical protein